MTNNNLGTIIFHNQKNGRTVKLEIEKETGNDYKVKIPVDLLYNSRHSVDNADNIPCITLVAREEIDSILKDIQLRLNSGWIEYVENQILGNNELTYDHGQNIGYVRQLHELIKEETRNRIREDNRIKSGEPENDGGWDAYTSNLNKLRYDVNNNTYNIGLLNTYDLPVGSIVPSLVDANFSKSFVKLNGTTVYGTTYKELVNLCATSDELHLEPNAVFNNISDSYQEMMNAIYAGYSGKNNTPTRLFMDMDDMVKLLGGNNAQSNLLNKTGEKYKVAFAGNSEIVKNMITEYYMLKYGNNSQYCMSTSEIYGNGTDKIELSVDSYGNLRYQSNQDNSPKTFDIGNVDVRNGYIQIVTIKNGGLIVGEYVYIKRDNGASVTTGITESVIRRRKDLTVFREVDSTTQPLEDIATVGTYNVTVESLVMPLTNTISPNAGRAYTTINMSEGVFLGGGDGISGLVDWSIPDMVLGNYGYTNGKDHARSAGAGGGFDFVNWVGYTEVKSSNAAAYKNHSNNAGKFYPKHYQVFWYQKARTVI